MVRRIAAVSLSAVLISVVMTADATRVQSVDHKQVTDYNLGISPMGRIARGDEPAPVVGPVPGAAIPGGPARKPMSASEADRLTHSPLAPDFQSETTIAKNGDWIVVGYNDIRGFSLFPVSVSGYAYSHDDGLTWTDGGNLPGAGNDAVYGDPDVKTWTDGNNTRYFVFSSLYKTPNGANSLCVHVSTDGGVTWAGPREVPPATSALDFADKEFIDIDPETGRLFISWTNFPNVGSQTIRTAYSDDLGLTWSAVKIFSSAGQGSVPRAAGNSDNVYIAWTTGNAITMARSIDNGVTWSTTYNAMTGLSGPMNPYGSDRIGNHPSMDVDPNNGNVYVVAASRNLAPDFSDIYFTSSTDGGLTFSARVPINASPGSDRAQFFPSVCADESDGSVSVIWYDQRAGTGTSDLTDLVHTHSTDAGVTWTCPGALTDQPFHAEAGNTTSQPNIGDYNQCVSVNGTLYSSFAKTDRPTWLTYSPDTYFDRSPGTGAGPAPAVIAGYSIVDSGCTSDNGFIEPGETIQLTLTLRNAGGCGGVSNVAGTLSSPTPGISVTSANAGFPDLPVVGSTSANSTAFQFTVDASVACGTTIDLVLDCTADGFGVTTLLFEGVLRVGRPMETVLLVEDFDGVTAPALPAGWSTSVVTGTPNPWRTSTVYAASGLNSAFCADITTTSHNELMSPVVNIPAGTEIVRVDLDETHNMEINVERQAWDGAVMRVLLGGKRYFAGALGIMDPFYPWQILRGSSSTSPLQDLACWSDNTTPNFAHYALNMPDLGGQSINLVFGMSCDPSVGSSSGMFLDNVTVTAVDYACDCGDPTPVASNPYRFDRVTVTPNPFNPETAIRFTLPSNTTVTAEVFAVDGRKVRTLTANQAFAQGTAELRWNGVDDRGKPVASGVYFVRVTTPLGQHMARAVLLK